MKGRIALLAGLAAAALTIVSCRTTPRAGDAAWTVESALVDRSARRVAAVRTNGVVDRFAADEVILRPRSPQELRRFVADHNGRVVRDGTLPPPPPTVAPDRVRPDFAHSDFVVIRVDPATADLAKLDNWIDEHGSGPVAFSSERAARLMAIVVGEVGAGVDVSPNWLMELADGDRVIAATREHPTSVGHRDGFNFAWANDPELGLTRAWQYWDLLDVPTGTVSLAIIDTGFASNPDFPPVGRLVQYDLVDDDNNVFMPPSALSAEDEAHGLRVASVAAARHDNRYGSVGTGGIADPSLAFIRPSRDGAPSIADAARSINIAAYYGADVICLSMCGRCNWWCGMLGALTGEGPLETAVNDAIAAGAIVIAAAGNDEADLDVTTCIPCALDGVICVGSMVASSKRAVRTGGGSNYGSPVNIWAPGVNIDTTPTPGSKRLSRSSGTSFAAPYVAGVVTLMRSVDPTLDAAGALAVLRSTAGTSTDPRVQPGFVNAYQALVAVAAAAGRAPREDSHEPNDDPVTATVLSADGVTATITPGDEDWYAVEVPDYAASFEATIDAPAAGGLGELQLDQPVNVAGILSPGRHLLRVKGATPDTINWYELTYSYLPAALEPDEFDVVTPSNDTLEDAAVVELVVIPDDPRFVMVAGPGVLQLGGKGMRAELAPLNIHDALDVDVFRIELDPSFAWTFETECPNVLVPPLPAGFEEIDRRGASRLHVRGTPVSVVDPQTGALIAGQRIPLTFTIYDSGGRPVSDPTIATGSWGIAIDCPHTLFPDGVVYLKIEAGHQRTFYRLEAEYREPYVLARDSSAADAAEPFYTYDIGEARWRSAFHDGSMHHVHDLPGEPEYLRFMWPDTGDFEIDLVAALPGAEPELALVDSGGRVIASSWSVDAGGALAHRRITVHDLEAGWYALQVRFVDGGQPYLLRSAR